MNFRVRISKKRFRVSKFDTVTLFFCLKIKKHILLTKSYPIMKNTTINVIDHETLTFNNGNEIKYAIDGYSIIFNSNPYGRYFRIIDDNKFEMYHYIGVITDNIPPMKVFEKIEQ